jgi:hypothetical protein
LRSPFERCSPTSHVLRARRADALWRSISDADTNGGKARDQTPFRSPAPTDLTPFRTFEHRLGCKRLDVRHVPQTRPPTPCHWKDQLHVGGIDLLMLGNANGPTKPARAQCLPE